MSFAKPKKPKYKAMPKAPKMSASLETWRRYESRVKAVIGENNKRKAEYAKKLQAYESAIKMRESIKAMARNAKTRF